MRYLAILLLIAGTNILFLAAQETTSTEVFLKAVNRPVVVYADSTGLQAAYTIMQDSIFGDYFRLTVDTASSDRFKVAIEKWTDYSPEISGWVAKDECGVYLLHAPSQQPPGYRLYEQPDNRSASQTLEGDVYGPADILDRQDKWLKLSFPLGGRQYQGWTDRYCPNIFDSCN